MFNSPSLSRTMAIEGAAGVEGCYNLLTPGPGPRGPVRNEGDEMEKLTQNIQEAFLNNARKDKTFLTIYLMSGVKLSGRIKSFDKYSVVLETNNQEQLMLSAYMKYVFT